MGEGQAKYGCTPFFWAQQVVHPSLGPHRWWQGDGDCNFSCVPLPRAVAMLGSATLISHLPAPCPALTSCGPERAYYGQRVTPFNTPPLSWRYYRHFPFIFLFHFPFRKERLLNQFYSCRRRSTVYFFHFKQYPTDFYLAYCRLIIPSFFSFFFYTLLSELPT